MGAEPGGVDTLGQRVAARRKQAGIGQRELARRAGCSSAMISQLENDKYGPGVSVGMVEKLAEALGCSPAELAFGGGQPGES